MSVRRIWRPSTIICLVAAVLIFVYGNPIAALLYAKWEVRNDPFPGEVKNNKLLADNDPN
jgi:hypothetical protein